MICRNCLRRASTLHPKSLPLRQISTTSPFRTPETAPRTTPPAATSTGPAQLFSTPLSPQPNDVSLGLGLRPKAKSVDIPISTAPAGTKLLGLNYLKGRDDPIALEESEYPEWLWNCLDEGGKKGDDGEEGVGDEFSKSKKLRRKAAKQQRKREERLAASGDLEALAPKIPITRQTIDLPGNEEGTAVGAIEAEGKRQELRGAMRKERRKNIKQTNFLKSM